MPFKYWYAPSSAGWGGDPPSFQGMGGEGVVERISTLLIIHR
jgi:hypothetical protein